MTPEEKCLAAYDRAYKILEMNNDHYFKRTQILMIVIQSALFLAFGKIASSAYTKHIAASNGTQYLTIGAASVIILSMLGIIGAIFWLLMITRQHRRMEFCRNYLRYLEAKMSLYSVPLNYCLQEQKAFYYDEIVSLCGTNEFKPTRWWTQRSVVNVEKAISIAAMVFWVVPLIVSVRLLIHALPTQIRQCGIFKEIPIYISLFPFGLGVIYAIWGYCSKKKRERSRPNAVSQSAPHI